MVLQTMLQRLYRAVMRGPGLNARPHSSRQRLDLLELRHFKDKDPASALDGLLQSGQWEVSAKVEASPWPSGPMSEWSPESRACFEAWKAQDVVMKKLHRIAGDARDYANDQGESALAIGFPLLSIPKGQQRQGFGSARVLAPIALVPVDLKVRIGSPSGIILSLAGEGDDLLVPNPSLIAYLESQTGEALEFPNLDEEASVPWQEVANLLKTVLACLGNVEGSSMDAQTLLQAVPKTDDLPLEPTLLPCAVLGLFPTRNLGLLRDTQWMISEEASLGHPVKSFLDSRATEAPTPHTLPDSPEIEPFASPCITDDDLLVAQADPCQSVAVRQARTAPALVVHGPPGTGKSQTIANIIGDHLARGERVLFVCEKRTALDVVKHRLDALGLGHLCGVIHDPTTDRRSFYMALRERLETLASEPLPRNPGPALKRLNKQLSSARKELSGYYCDLHRPGEHGEKSFHEAVGHWLGLHGQVATIFPDSMPTLPGGYTPDDLQEHRIAIDEALRRAQRLTWSDNPWRAHPPAPLNEVLSKSSTETTKNLQTLADRSEQVDAPLARHPIWPQESLSQEAFDAASKGLVTAITALAKALGSVECELLQRYSQASPEMLQSWAEQAHRLHAEANALSESPLHQDWLLTTQQERLSMAQVNERLVAIENWTSASGIRRLFRFFRSGEARKALAPLGMSLTDSSAADAMTYYRGVRTRLSLAAALEHVGSEDWLGDDSLMRHWRSRDLLATAFQALLPGQAAHPWSAMLREACEKDEEAVTTLLPRLEATADRLKEANDWVKSADDAGVFSQSTLDAWAERTCTSQDFKKPATSLLEHQSEFEDAARLEDSLQTLPESLSAAVRAAASQGWDTDQTTPLLELTAYDEALRARLASSENLSSLDGHRIEAAFQSIAELSDKKQQLVRNLASYEWQVRQRERLLANTGTRLNPLGASLRQRLFVRGKKALKLRQMIMTGADTPQGDPLFDVCPVWLAGPGTVAQILPRTPLFDSVVFDEASQCRLEEALPVLLRGHRVVIAGDPRQLPPSRFFEATILESSDTNADTVEELFEQRQSETEDLLSAALNLSVEEAFLDVHYRSRNEALIQFSNESFYQSRLQAVPAHPSHRALQIPVDLRRVEGIYEDRSNEQEGKAAVELVAELLDSEDPPSIGIACFNLVQRDLIDDLLDERAEQDRQFGNRLAVARSLERDDAFEGLFVKNLENVQGDERDVMIISTTFGPDQEGKFRRNFGTLNRAGGGRRLNVLVTRARYRIIVLTSIPRREYVSLPQLPEGKDPNGRYYLYAYLHFAESLKHAWEEGQQELEAMKRDEPAFVRIEESTTPSPIARALGETLLADHGIGNVVHWGNEGFSLDTALTHPNFPADVTAGVLADFTRYNRTTDPISWDLFRSSILKGQGWKLHRVWSPSLFRKREGEIEKVVSAHAHAMRSS